MIARTRLLSIATAVPANVVRQDTVSHRVSGFFREAPATVERFGSVFGNAGIETRYACLPLDWYEDDHGWSDRNPLYIDHALALIEQAARLALDRAGLPAGAVDQIVCVSTTGIATPSLEARLLDRLPFRRDVRRLPVFGLGCGGGVIGLARAAALAASAPGERVLLLVVEPCALTFRRRDLSAGNIVATALFGDGAAAALLSTVGTGPAVVASGEYTWPHSLDVMGWTVEDDGFGVVFSRDIPMLVRRDFRPPLDAFLARHGLSLADIEVFLCHPGGAKVLDALEDALDLAQGALALSRSVLRDYGNMSAATVMFVLERAHSAGSITGPALLSAFGPGFSAGFAVLAP